MKVAYEGHLRNITETISRFKNAQNRATAERTKLKYQKAINKLKKIQALVITRYKIILDLEKLSY